MFSNMSKYDTFCIINLIEKQFLYFFENSKKKMEIQTMDDVFLIYRMKLT